ncbi:6-phosphogluconolactonase [Actimicrobium antarcticum]|uniref:6-phosphogluconolactonase n=1 Tax=Actimicrobium antarcticum TaxID=1051899 RepID=A0ABP7U0U6_9BURK
MTVQFHLFDNTALAAQALADAVAIDLRLTLESAPRALLLVSGGRSPLPLFGVLAALALPWSQIDVSLVDERCVPPGHADSNSTLVAQHLLVGPAALSRWVPLVDVAVVRTTDGWSAARQSAASANRNPALATASVVILGLGNDGHTASLFADAPQWDDARTTTERYIALQPGVAPHPRVGLSLQALIDQRHCYIWSSGAEKRATLDRLVHLVRAVEAGHAQPEQLIEAGPLALLIAHQKATLHVFHSAS